jgi:cyclophilin family peptidyl-prolyl cis-trans isomerase
MTRPFTHSISSSLIVLFVIFLGHGGNNFVNGFTMDRRSCLQLLQVLQVMDLPSSSSSSSPNTITAMPDAEITHKVFMDIRISRNDGSFYVRDDLPDTFENRVIKTRLTFGLYGKLTPNHVEKFLSYIITPDKEDVDNPFPSYGRSTFKALDQETGLLQGGNIPSLRVKDIGGSTAITYGSRVLPANLWIDRKSSPDVKKLSHSTKGLLTHKSLDATPSFGITTRASPSLDATHTIFGQVIWDEPTLQWFRDLQDLPTYALEARPGDDVINTGGVAASVFNAQRGFFRGAAKSLGDTRVDGVYEGKLLRRMEVTQVGRL